MTLSPEDQKKLYELAENADRHDELGGFAQEWTRQLISAVLDPCKPPEPEKVEQYMICDNNNQFVDLMDSPNGARDAVEAYDAQDPDNAPHVVTYLSGYRGQGKPEDGE